MHETSGRQAETEERLSKRVPRGGGSTGAFAETAPPPPPAPLHRNGEGLPGRIERRAADLGGADAGGGLSAALLARRQAGEVVLHQILQADGDVVVLEALHRLILITRVDLAVVNLGVVLEPLVRVRVLDRIVWGERLITVDVLLVGRCEHRVVDGI